MMADLRTSEEQDQIFDRPDFNAVQYVNTIFPDEDSLSKLEPFIESLKLRIRHVDHEILEAVRQQSSSGSHARTELRSAQASIASMLQQVVDIRRRASHAEAMVQDICRDIKKLDYAKKHLTTTITALRRLSMLITAVDQLQLSVEKRDFSEAAHLLGAVQELAAHFSEYSHVPRVAEMRGRVAALEQSLRVASLREFELLGEDPPSPAFLDRLKECCAVTAALGASARDELVDAICRREMGIYTQIFSTTGETAKLERTMNRYKWLLRRLEARREIWAIFPPNWRVAQLLTVTFSSITKTQLAEILDTKSSELPHQVDNLLKAVEATHIFEAEMARRFEGPVGGAEVPLVRGINEHSDDDGNGPHAAATDTYTQASEVRRKYEHARSRRQDDSAITTPNRSPSPSREMKQQHAAAEAVARASFRGSISQVFIPYMWVYVDQVERQLMWNVDQIVQTENWLPLAADQHILKSSNDLTDAVRSEMKDCVARVSRGKPLIDLSRVFGRVYRAYADKLMLRLPKTAAGSTGGTATLGGTDWQVKLNDGDTEAICLIATTSEHCIDMLRQLEKALVARLDPGAQKPLPQGVDFSQEEDIYRGLLSAAISILVLSVETRLESPLAMLMRQNWGAVQSVGDQSGYVAAMQTVFHEVGSRAGASLYSTHFRFFCDKLLRSVAPRIKEAVFRCRGITEAGCQQLRLDLEAVKGALIAMSKMGRAEGDSSTWIAEYSVDVSAQVGYIEAALKVVSSPAAAFVDSFMELMPDAGPVDFQRIADLKGFKRSEVSSLLGEYGERMGQARVLPPPVVGDADGREEEASSGQWPTTNGSGIGQTGMHMRSSSGSSFRMPHHGAASKASAAAQDVASRLRLNANVQAARASAAAAGDSMRETTGRMLGAMKGLRFMQRDGAAGV